MQKTNKKKMMIVCMVVSVLYVAYASTFTKQQVFDDFGDPIKGSSTIISETLPCTYKTPTIQDGSAEFKMIINDAGYVGLDISSKEWSGIPGGKYTSDTFTVTIRPDEGPDIVKRGVKISQASDLRWTVLWLGKIVSNLAGYKSVRIIVKNDNVTINLGTIDTFELEELYYDKTGFNEICRFIEKGDHPEALKLIDLIETQSPESYVYYGLADVKSNIHTSDSGSITKEPTCTECGTKTYYCTVCGGTLRTESIPAKGHIIDKGKVSTEPTCGATGTMAFYCTVCGSEVKTEPIQATGKHQFGKYDCLICGHPKYQIGDTGPAGGLIFYDCDADNDKGNEDGLRSSNCGWRYLEAARSDLRAIKGTPSIDPSASGYSKADIEYVFGYYCKKYNTSSLYVNGTTRYNANDCTSGGIGSGKRNTTLLVSAMGDSTYYINDAVNKKTGEYAARLCDILKYTYNGVVFDDWFLPSLSELYFVNKVANLNNDSYWSSTESDGSPGYIWALCYGEGRYIGAEYGLKVRPVRAF